MMKDATESAGAQMTRAYYLGIDAGTSGLKALVIDGHGKAVAQGTASYALRTSRPGWVEGDPEEWWSALCAATRQALAAAGIGGAQIAAVGFSGQMHTLVLLDAAVRPVRPAISWADARGASERTEIEARVGRARLIAITGSPAVSAFTATKLLWVRRHERCRRHRPAAPPGPRLVAGRPGSPGAAARVAAPHLPLGCPRRHGHTSRGPRRRAGRRHACRHR